jgi:hypothetical protein
VWVHEAGYGGVVIVGGAGVTLRGALLEQNDAVGVVVESAEAKVEATVVRATQPDGTGAGGRGIDVGADSATRSRTTPSVTSW